MDKNKALTILHANMAHPGLRKHSYAVGYSMGAIYDYFKDHNMLESGSPDKETWEVVGVLHDSDYEITKEDWENHTKLTLEWLKKDGISENDPIYKAIASHNTKRTNLKPVETQMEWALECVDELTGFITACAMVKDKKLSNVTIDTIKNNWKKKGFAGGVIREQVEQCADKLNIPLEDFYELTLKVMQAHSDELGL